MNGTDNTGKVVHVNFQAGSRPRSKMPKYVIRPGEPIPFYRPQSSLQWLRTLDLRAPWLIRLAAVLLILGLSLLVL